MRCHSDAVSQIIISNFGMFVNYYFTDMKKAYQELYGLINYGELRKKQRVLNLKTAVKLSELVERGTTTIKVRGKTFRIKTPVCRALKKLNQLEDTDQIRVPCKLCVELIPHDGSTWESVQQVSHNPRVRVYVPLQRTLSSLIRYFEERWKTGRSRLVIGNMKKFVYKI